MSASQRISRHFHSLVAALILSMGLTACRVGPNYRPPVVQFHQRSAARTCPDLRPTRLPLVPATGGRSFMTPNSTLSNSRSMLPIPISRSQLRASTRRQRSLAIHGRICSQVSVRSPRSPARARRKNRPNNGATSGRAATYNEFLLPLVLNYEIDAWGRVRRTVELREPTSRLRRRLSGLSVSRPKPTLHWITTSFARTIRNFASSTPPSPIFRAPSR